MYNLIRKFVFGLCCLVLFSVTIQAQAVFNENYAEKLKLLGVFQGTDLGFELDREPTRLEGLVIMLRLLGEEENAKKHIITEEVFEDVPQWGKPYVYYAYSKGITKGVIANRFEPDTSLQSKAFLTYALRAMSYRDGTDAAADFVWDQPELLAMSKRIVNEEQLAVWSMYPFYRRDAVRVAYAALNADMKDGQQLAEVLINRGVFTKEKAMVAELSLKEEKKVEQPSESKIIKLSNKTETASQVPQNTPHPSELPEPVKPEFPDEKPYSLVGPATATKTQLYNWARKNGMSQEGLELIDLYYEISEKKGLNPVIQYAQMCHETGFLYRDKKSLAGLDASYHNPCGLKVTEGGDGFKAESHKKFADWREGIEAHTDHTALYAGVPGYPKADTPDPRHFKYLRGRATMLADLSNNWAPSWYYHRKIYAMLLQIEKETDVVSR